MGTAVVSEDRRLHGAGNGHGGTRTVKGTQAVQRVKAERSERRDRCWCLQEIMRLVDASKEGRSSERGKADHFNGIHREMVQGVNEMLDAILLPIGEGNRILAQISNGKIDELIAQTYKGDHEKMKQAVNNVAMVLQGLQKELARLTEASQGRTTLRARQARTVPGRLRRDRARRQRHAGCHPAAHRRRQPHSGADLQRQDRRTDRANLQGRPREDEAGRSTTWPWCCRACRKSWRG